VSRQNRIALQSDLSAQRAGIPNVLLLTGDHRARRSSDAKAVFDLDSIH